jgi:hypothetical protein
MTSLFAVYLLIAGRPLGRPACPVQASNLETVREFGKKHGGILIRLIVSTGANVLGRQRPVKPTSAVEQPTPREESPKRV